jgi:hypothetical protein
MSLKIDIFGSKDLLVGEVDTKGFTIKRSDGVAITLVTATFEIFDKSGQSLSTATGATITNNATTLVTISASISAGTNTGEKYVEFVLTTSALTKKVRLEYEVFK